MPRKSVDRRRKFAAAYLANGGNATQAAISAGFSEKTAHQAGHRMLKNVEVQKLLEAGVTRMLKAAEITQDKLVEELASVAFTPVEMKFVDEGEKLRAKSAALVNLAKLCGFWKEKSEVDAGPNLLELIERSMKR